MTGELNPEQLRHKHGQLFLVAPIEGGVEILYAGALFATIEIDERLPAGFIDRFIAHAMDLLTGRRSSLWDEQIVHGAEPFNIDKARDRAAAQATIDAAAREASK
jgi:hypothetical protein